MKEYLYPPISCTSMTSLGLHKEANTFLIAWELMFFSVKNLPTSTNVSSFSWTTSYFLVICILLVYFNTFEFWYIKNWEWIYSHYKKKGYILLLMGRKRSKIPVDRKISSRKCHWWKMKLAGQRDATCWRGSHMEWTRLPSQMPCVVGSNYSQIPCQLPPESSLICEQPIFYRCQW